MVNARGYSKHVFECRYINRNLVNAGGKNEMIGFSCLKRFVLFLVLYTALPAWSLPQPAYLRVPHWQRCVNTTTKGNAMFVCLPTKKTSCLC